MQFSNFQCISDIHANVRSARFRISVARSRSTREHSIQGSRSMTCSFMRLEGGMFFNFESSKMHFTLEGQGAPLMFLHGLGGRAENWFYQRRFFSQSRTVICVDLPGQGRSEGHHLPFTQFPNVIEALLDELDIPACDFAGLSKGARVALAFAARHRNRVSAVIVVNTFLHLTEHDETARRGLYELLTNEDGGAEWARRLLNEMGVADNRAISRGFMRSLATFDPRHIQRLFLEVMHYDQRDEVAQFSGPVLIVRGDADRFVPAYCSLELNALLPQSDLALMRGCGHLPYLEMPDEFNLLVADFLSRKSTL